MSKNIFCLYGKIHLTNASALAVKYGTRRAKPAGNAIEFGLLSARYISHFVSITSINLNPPTVPATLTTIHIHYLVFYMIRYYHMYDICC